MERSLSEHLVRWKNSNERKPLIIRGARQVGKSFLVNELGKSFDHFVEINFEMEPSLSVLFRDSLDPEEIINKIRIAKNTEVIPEKTLLFFDEVQAAPNALTALRYFYERMPQLHVIAAGSLIEFVLETIGIPVGRVSNLFLYPLSFKEFLIASGKAKLCEHVEQLEADQSIDDLFHKQLMALFAQYMAVGGMPEAVKSWIENRDMKRVWEVHNDIIETFKQDFLKYAKKQQIHHVEKLFSVLPRLVGKKFVYSHVDQSLKGREIKPALELLEKAQVLHRIRHTSANGVPLEGECNNSLFKTIFLDIGLTQAILGLSTGDWILDPEKSVINKGQIVEAFAGQELLAYSDPHARKKLFYWVREKAHAQSEVDYVAEKEDRIIPIEVKSGVSGSLKSLMQFLHEKPKAQYGVHISANNFGKYRNIRQLPVYALWKLNN